MLGLRLATSTRNASFAQSKMFQATSGATGPRLRAGSGSGFHSFPFHRSEPHRLNATWQAQQLADASKRNPQFMVMLPAKRDPRVLIHQQTISAHSAASSEKSVKEEVTGTSSAKQSSKVLWMDLNELFDHQNSTLVAGNADHSAMVAGDLEVAEKFIKDHNVVLIGTSTDPTDDDPATQYQAHFAICSNTFFSNSTTPEEVAQGFHELLNKRSSTHITDSNVMALSPRKAVFASTEAPMNDVDKSVIGVASSLLSWTSNLVDLASSDPTEPVVSKSGGWAMDLKGTGATNYPRIDPVVIGLIVDTTTDSMLLTRKSSSHKKRYTCVAGFMEVGETMEQSMAREIKEEVGIRVSGVEYKLSQPWPFGPGNTAQLMIGCVCTMASAEGIQHVQLDDELEEAQWFTRVEVEEMLSRTDLNDTSDFHTAPHGTIAYQLLKQWASQPTSQL